MSFHVYQHSMDPAGWRCVLVLFRALRHGLASAVLLASEAAALSPADPPSGLGATLLLQVGKRRIARVTFVV